MFKQVINYEKGIRGARIFVLVEHSPEMKDKDKRLEVESNYR